MIVTITPTVMDGTVLRWYAGDEATGRPVMSVSRHRVQIRDHAHLEPGAAFDAAQAYAELKHDRYADVRHYATHYRTRSGLVPVKAGE